ncbi:hypothetical protein [Georgenia sp. SUBG003]|uniref:hypothetical protein n=1 Tax=Georgenia sp. SUBG003 TaxID=1497974 RepID=UPI0004DAED0E|nr:hypothetical protein DA06_21740 [Georgenia sp. SUBG003]
MNEGSQRLADGTGAQPVRTGPDAAVATSEPSPEPALRQQFAQLAPLFALAVRVLRLPSLALASAPVPALAVLAWLASTWESPARAVGLVVTALGGTAVAVFVVRRARYLQATNDVAALADDLVAFTDLSDLDAEVSDALRSLVDRGGLRLLPRVRGFWALVSLPSRVEEHVGSLERLRWFLPPVVGTTVTLIHVQVTVAVLSWVLLGLAVPGTLLNLF